jgi:hypothetical protein
MAFMPRLLVIAATLATVVVSLLAPATPSAAVPCRDRIYNDWYHDGKIASSYSTACFRDALKHIPTDAKFYSSLETDIKAAMLASFRIKHGATAPKQVGHGLAAIGHGAPSTGTPQLVSAPKPHGLSPGVTETVASAPVADTSSSGTPLPILVLGGVALALAAAGAVGTGVRYARRRR